MESSGTPAPPFVLCCWHMREEGPGEDSAYMLTD